METSNDALAQSSESNPNVKALLDEYELAWTQDGLASSRIAISEDVRYARWEGQSADGLKHQENLPEGVRAMPYDRAPDTRVLLADGVINKLVNLQFAAFWGARMKTAPASTGKLTMMQAAELRALISWMIHGPLREDLIDDVELAAQVLQTIGWVVLHPCWRNKVHLRMRHLTLRDIIGLSQLAPPQSVLAHAPELIADPTLEDAAVELLRSLHPNLKEGRARRVIKELRKNGEAEFPVPSQVQNEPELAVLIPWQDFVLPSEATANPREARAMFRRKFYTEAKLRSVAKEQEWTEAFVDAVIQTAGQTMEHGLTEETAEDKNQRLIEIVYAFSRGVDDDGIEALYCTVISPHLSADPQNAKLYGAHWLVDDALGEYPFIILTTEVTGRRPTDARGVPDVLATPQMELKQQRDATYVFSQMSVTPPLQKKGTQASKLPPELGPMGILNNASGGEWSWFAPPPANPEIAFELQKNVILEAADYYDIPGADGNPNAVVGQQKRVMRWLAKWGVALKQLAVLAYQYLSPAELEEILGRPPLLSADMVVRHHILLWFDARSLDNEWVENLFKTVMQILPVDTAGKIDHAKLIDLMLAYLDPTLAEEVTTDMEGAKQALFKSTREEIGQIMLGNEALYTENDPQAKAKLMFGQQVMANNPDYQQIISPMSPKFDERKAVMLQKWEANLMQSVKQQENKIIGRLGVRPGPEPATAEAGEPASNGNGRY